MEPSSATISDPGGIRPRWGLASSLVVFAAIRMPAARSSLVAFWEVAIPEADGATGLCGHRCDRLGGILHEYWHAA